MSALPHRIHNLDGLNMKIFLLNWGTISELILYIDGHQNAFCDGVSALLWGKSVYKLILGKFDKWKWNGQKTSAHFSKTSVIVAFLLNDSGNSVWAEVN